MFKDDGTVPNNSALPALVYKGAVDVDSKHDPASTIEKLFATNGWGHGQWRDGIYPFVHYHSMIHETLGIARGRAKVQLGGHRGEMFELAPDGTYNLCRGDNPAERDKALTRIPQVPLPESDPVLGKDGPLPQIWRR